ncbi:hypothetical protein DPEC_G00063440 [Dallia pectoralis]|uniref:Uncharacterized protein n=1 Tax=Dallia pectoralis TaxID=75939 RepID=A0ACC2H869_DALPE|nr:hypothetical protein DPEC_G00063440 [Dallia pectoralis]
MGVAGETPSEFQLGSSCLSTSMTGLCRLSRSINGHHSLRLRPPPAAQDQQTSTPAGRAYMMVGVRGCFPHIPSPSRQPGPSGSQAFEGGHCEVKKCFPGFLFSMNA